MLKRNLGIFLLVAILVGCSKVGPSERFPELQLVDELRSRRFLPHFQSEAMEATGTRVYSSKKDVLKITRIQAPISEVEAIKEMVARVKALTALYGYEAKIDAKSVFQIYEYNFCGTLRQTRRLTSSDGEVSMHFHLFATNKFAYSVCSQRLDTLKSQYQLLYCRNSQSLYEIRFFYPLSAPVISVPVAKCR